MSERLAAGDAAATRRTEEIVATVEGLRSDMLAFAQELVRIPSLPGDENKAHQHVAAKLEDIGLDVDVLESRFDDLDRHPAFNDDGLPRTGRINIVGRWVGLTPATSRSLILNGHLDVVSPGNPELWTHPPFSGAVEGTRLFGRGSCDMKSGVTAAIFAVQALVQMGQRLGGDVLLQTVSGEESGGVGTLTTIVKGYRADAAIIMEPTQLKLCPIQSGALTFRMVVQGHSIHACMKRLGVSAIEKACYLIGRLNAFDRARHLAHPNPYYPDPLNIAPISVGTLAGGDWHSTVPQEAVIEGRFGIFAGESVADGKRRLHEAIHEAAAADDWLRDHPPSLEWFEGQFESGQTDRDEPILQELAKCHADVTGSGAVTEGVTYGSDLRLFTNHAGIPAVLYGPGNVAHAHTINEFIDFDEVVTASKVLALMVDTWCASR